MTLTQADLKAGHWYKAKRVREYLFRGPNDRYIMRLSPGNVQFDGPEVKDGRHYPTVSIEKFLKWADRELTPEEIKQRENLPA